jgi:hypothetical protein
MLVTANDPETPLMEGTAFMSAESTMFCEHIHQSNARPVYSVHSLLTCTGLAGLRWAPGTDQQRLDQGRN